MHLSIVNIRVTAFARDLHWSLSGLGLGLGLGVALGLQVLMTSRCRPEFRRGEFRNFGVVAVKDAGALSPGLLLGSSSL